MKRWSSYKARIKINFNCSILINEYNRNLGWIQVERLMRVNHIFVSLIIKPMWGALTDFDGLKISTQMFDIGASKWIHYALRNSLFQTHNINSEWNHLFRLFVSFFSNLSLNTTILYQFRAKSCSTFKLDCSMWQIQYVKYYLVLLSLSKG